MSELENEQGDEMRKKSRKNTEEDEFLENENDWYYSTDSMQKYIMQ
jgi:hypothetical protein